MKDLLQNVKRIKGQIKMHLFCVSLEIINVMWVEFYHL